MDVLLAVEEPPPSECDAWAALIPAEHDEGCTLRVQVTIADQWQPVGVFFLVLLFVCLGALVVGQLRR